MKIHFFSLTKGNPVIIDEFDYYFIEDLLSLINIAERTGLCVLRYNWISQGGFIPHPSLGRIGCIQPRNNSNRVKKGALDIYYSEDEIFLSISDIPSRMMYLEQKRPMFRFFEKYPKVKWVSKHCKNLEVKDVEIVENFLSHRWNEKDYQLNKHLQIQSGCRIAVVP